MPIRGLIWFCTLFLASAVPALAETKILTADAMYIMGDGETPDFAEARVLQKAKQAALEEAGTYVESYTRSQNLDVTAEEIQTIAGGVLEVEILEKTRSLVSEGLRFYLKIKATVTTDRMEELAHRIRGRKIATEYRRLQEDYARVSAELDDWKRRAAELPPGQSRTAALQLVHEKAQAFAQVQRQEGELYQRLVSGEQLVALATRDQATIDRLLQRIVKNGFVVSVGDVKAVAVAREADMLAINVPLTISASKVLYDAVSEAARALGGVMRPDVDVWVPVNPSDGLYPLRIGTSILNEATVSLVRMGKYRETAEDFQDKISNLGVLLQFDGTRIGETAEPFRCRLGREDKDSLSTWLYGSPDAGWFPVRRMFPVLEVEPFSSIGKKASRERITNGEYEGRISSHETSEESRQDIPDKHGYVAIVRDESSFVAQLRLNATLARGLTGVRVQVLSDRAQNKQYQTALRCAVVQ